MKSQSIVVEHVILFTIALGIFIISLLFFTTHQARFSESILLDQLTGVKEYLSSYILELSLKKENCSYVIKIPRKVGEEYYKITLSDNGLNITSLVTHRYVFSTLFNLNQSIRFSGEVTSEKGSMIIYKTGNKITIS